MFAPLSRFFRRPESQEVEHAFVRGVQLEHPREPRSRRLERVLLLGWGLVLLKSLLVHWAVAHYRVPFNAWWLIGPTFAFAALCTWLYWRRD